MKIPALLLTVSLCAAPAFGATLHPDTPSPTDAKIAPGLLDQLDVNRIRAAGPAEAPLYRIVVELRETVTKTPLELARVFADPAAEAARTQDIAALQSHVIRTLGTKRSAGSVFAIGNLYRTIYGFSAAADAESIRQLASLPEVVSITEMPVHRQTDLEAHALTNTDEVHLGRTGGAGVTIAVIDDGIDHDHAAFGGHSAYPNAKILGGHDYGDGDTDPRIDCFAQDHGTAAAGIAVGNGGGITGAAPDASLVFYKVQSADFCQTTTLDGDTTAAIDRAVADRNLYDPPIRVISMSFGIPNVRYTGPCASVPAERLALQAARAAGLVTVVASGNDGFTNGIESPACHPDAVSVGAVYDADMGARFFPACNDPTTAADQAPCYSNSATFLDLLAPSDCAVTASPTGTEPCFDGTSAATPYAAGIAALAFSANPKISREAVIELLKKGPDVVDPRNGVSTPRVDSSVLCSDGPFASTETVRYTAIPQSGRVSTTGFWVYYGTHQTTTSKHFPFGQTVQCDNATFGDPVPGVAKTCFLFTSTNWMRPMASEGGSFQLHSGEVTRTYQRQNNCPTVRPCTTAELQGDPAPYFYKQCTFTDALGADQADEGDHFSIHWGPSEPLDVTISCTGDFAGNHLVACTANPSGGSPPYSYRWNYYGSATYWYGNTSQTARASYSGGGCQPSSYNHFVATVTDAFGVESYTSVTFGCP